MRFRVAGGLPAGGRPAARRSRSWSKGSKAASRTRRCSASPGSGKTFTIANVIQRVQRPTLVMAHNKTLAAQLYGEFKEFFPQQRGRVLRLLLRLLPARGLRAVVGHVHREGRVDQRAHRADAALGDQGAARAAATRSSSRPCRRSTASATRRPTSRWCCTWCAASASTSASCCAGSPTCSTRATSSTSRRGTYRVRGDVIDIFPAESEREAVRVELFDDEIETLSWFDPLTGEVLRKVPRLTVYPSSHYVTPQGAHRPRDRRDPRGAARAAASSCAGRTSWSRRSGSSSARTFDLEMMKEVGYCSGIENYSRYLSGRAPGEPPPCLFDYLPTDALLVVDESHVTIPQLGAHVQGRPLAQGDAGRVRLPPAVGARQPAAALRGIRAAGAADDLRLGDAAVRTRARAVRRRSSSRSCARPASSIRRSRSARCARRWTTCCPRSACASSVTSACWSRR